jgi:hypothetical protein
MKDLETTRERRERNGGNGVDGREGKKWSKETNMEATTKRSERLESKSGVEDREGYV